MAAACSWCSLVVATTAGTYVPPLRPDPVGGGPGAARVEQRAALFNMLVVGSDSRDSLDDADGSRYGDVGGQRNDTTLVVRVELARKRVSMLSIPRDLVVPIAGTGGENRINAAFQGGPGQLVKTVEQTSIPIHHYVLIDFDGFRAIVDALGGIDVRFPYSSRDLKSGLDIREAGCRHLAGGGRAFALARSRYFAYQLDGVWHSDPWADLGRIRRQQAFLQSLVKAALDKGLTNPVRANAFVGSLVHEVTKDSALRVGDVIRTGAAFRSFSPSKLGTYTLPVTVASDHPLGDVLLLKQPDADTVVDRFLGRATRPRRRRPRQHPGHRPQRPRHQRPGRHHRHQAPHLGLPDRHRRQRPLRRPRQVADQLRSRPPGRRQESRQHPPRRRPPDRRPHPRPLPPHPHPRPRLHRHPPRDGGRAGHDHRPGGGRRARDPRVGHQGQQEAAREGRSRPPPLRPPPLLTPGTGRTSRAGGSRVTRWTRRRCWNPRSFEHRPAEPEPLLHRFDPTGPGSAAHLGAWARGAAGAGLDSPSQSPRAAASKPLEPGDVLDQHPETSRRTCHPARRSAPPGPLRMPGDAQPGPASIEEHILADDNALCSPQA